MSTWCLLPKYVEEFKRGLKSGEIDPAKLAIMTSLERNAFFTKMFGEENAQQINSLFESKLLLKNQKAGYISWAKKIGGLSPKIRQDVLTKIQKMSFLDPVGEEQFLQDLASTRLKINVTQEEAKTIADLAKNVVDAKIKYDIDEVSKLTDKEGLALMKDSVKNKTRLEYGDTVVALSNYRTYLKLRANNVTLEEFKKSPFGVVAKGAKTSINLSKSMNASYDDSAILNQGFPVLANVRTAPIWARNAIGTLKNIVNIFGGKPVWDKVRADVVSRPNYINGKYKDSKLAVDVAEEDFPTSLPEKLADWKPKNKIGRYLTKPVNLFGKGYKASEVAFNAFQLRNRVDVFDLLSALAEKNGLDTTPQGGGIEGLGKFINALTARGRMGKLEPVANILNAPFFSLRKQVANVESLFAYQLGKQSPFVRKQGASAAIQQLSLISLILGIAYAFNKDSIELDPTSADFGKIRVGSTRFDLTQGRAGYIVLAMRILLNRTKSSTTGETRELNTDDWGSLTSSDLFVDFTQNKLSPFLNNLIYIINRQDRERNKPTVGSVLSDLYIPLNFKNIPEMLNDPNSANFIASTIANFLGVQVNSYPNSNAKSQLIPTNTVITSDSFLNAVQVYAKALGTDPETAFNRIFTGQKIMQVSDGGIIVVNRDSISDIQKFKEDWVKENGGSIKDIKEVKADHTIPHKMGGEGLGQENIVIVTNSVWASYTKVENALIRAVKKDKVSLKEAQKLIVEFKEIDDTSDRKEFGEELIKRFR